LLSKGCSPRTVRIWIKMEHDLVQCIAGVVVISDFTIAVEHVFIGVQLNENRVVNLLLKILCTYISNKEHYYPKGRCHPSLNDLRQMTYAAPHERRFCSHVHAERMISSILY
jgi:hypothetical protein